MESAGDTSQYAEGAFIRDHFAGKLGAFLDIGAADGIINSNTRMLADAGWAGVLVEPAPQMFCQLMKNYQDYPWIRLVNAAVGKNAAVQTLWVNTPDAVTVDQLSTLDLENKRKWQASGYPFREIYAPVVTWKDLLIGINQWVFDFVNIDVEGINAQVLAAMPIRPKMICVEADPVQLVTDIVARFYPNTKTIGGNVLGWL